MVRPLQRFDRTESAPPARPIRAGKRSCVAVVGTCCGRPFARPGFFSFAARGCRLVQVIDIGHVIQCCWSGRATRASGGLIWPKDGYASIAYAATAPARLSSPGLRPFLARQESLSAAVLRCAPARRRVRRRSPSACRSPSRPRWSQASNSKGEVTWQASAPSRSRATSSRAKS
jgi:hypothetical protein